MDPLKVITARNLVAALESDLQILPPGEWLTARPDLQFASDTVALLCHRLATGLRLAEEAGAWLEQLALHEEDPANNPPPEMPSLARGDVERAFPLVEIVREQWAWAAQHEPDKVLFYARVEGRAPDSNGGPKSALRAQDMIELLDRGDALVREYLETLTSAAIRIVGLRRTPKGPPPKRELTFRKVGTDVSGREVLEVEGCTDLYGAVEAITAYCTRLQVTRSLLWNGVATTCYPGMTPEEFLIENEIRRDAYRSREWPKQLVPFGGEIDAFKIFPLPSPQGGKGEKADEEPATPPVRKCNRHDDCDKADEDARTKGRLSAAHCHDETCEDCFGQ